MAREFARAFYSSKEWIKCRASFIKKRQGIDGGLCEMCGKNLGLIVHHKIKLSEANMGNPEVSLNHNNLEYLCQNCHNEIHGYVRKKLCTDEIAYSFDADGNPVAAGYPPET